MEIWLRPNDGEKDAETGKVDRVFSEGATQDHLRAVDGVLYQGERVLGAHVIINDGTTQNDGIAHMGTVDWIMVECKTWSMIPLENLIAHRSGSHTKIAAVINTPLEAQGAGFALEQGVDALVISSEPAMLEAALSVKAQRLERHEPDQSFETAAVDSLQLAPLSVESEQAGLGDRYCLDFLSSFSARRGNPRRLKCTHPLSRSQRNHPLHVCANASVPSQCWGTSYLRDDGRRYNEVHRRT